MISKEAERNFVESVAAGLRRMSVPPDFFVCADGFFWATDDILGIPLLYTALLQNDFCDEHVPLIPLWRAEGGYIVDRKQFNYGFLEGK